MNRKPLYTAFVVAMAAILIVGCAPKKNKTQKKPNFLFVLVDDQSPFDLQTYDPNSILQTPTIDKLAKQGVVFESARHMGSMNGAVCTPSRHMIMTGRTLWHLPKSAGYRESLAPDSLEQQSIAAVFKPCEPVKKGTPMPRPINSLPLCMMPPNEEARKNREVPGMPSKY